MNLSNETFSILHVNTILFISITVTLLRRLTSSLVVRHLCAQSCEPHSRYCPFSLSLRSILVVQVTPSSSYANFTSRGRECTRLIIIGVIASHKSIQVGISCIRFISFVKIIVREKVRANVRKKIVSQPLPSLRQFSIPSVVVSEIWNMTRISVTIATLIL